MNNCLSVHEVTPSTGRRLSNLGNRGWRKCQPWISNCSFYSYQLEFGLNTVFMIGPSIGTLGIYVAKTMINWVKISRHRVWENDSQIGIFVMGIVIAMN